MKNIKTCLVLLACMGLNFSCSKDFLNQQPVGGVNDGIVYSPDGIKKLLIGAYAPLNGTIGNNGALVTTPAQFVFGSMRGGEVLKGSSITDQSQWIEIQKYLVNTGNISVQAAFKFFYDGIYRCNLVIAGLEKIQGLSTEEKNKISAEARFLRGHYHFILKRIFNNIPFISEKSLENTKVPNVDGNGNYVNIWSDIESDFDFARKNLPNTQQDLGRPNRWAAECYYAKSLIYAGCDGEQAAFQKALTVLTDVISNGVTSKGEKYALLSNYHDNFNIDTENNAEFVFGVQCSANDGTTTLLGPTFTNVSANSNYDPIHIGTSNIDGGGGGFTFMAPTQWFVDHFRVNEDGLPYLDNYSTNPVSVKNDDGISVDMNFTPETKPLDPRLDWTVGRRGIQYLDYAVYGGASWVRDQSTAGPYLTKKYFAFKKDLGKYTTGSWPINALNIAIIRYADVLLLAAEMEARVGSLDKARDYVNTVRNRMAVNSSSASNWVKKVDGITNAANYKIGLYPVSSTAFADQKTALSTILFERTLELGCEGHRAYDLVRFGKLDNRTDVEEIGNFLAFESKKRQWLSGVSYSGGDKRYMPIPQVAINNSQEDGKPTLKQNPGY